MTQESKDLLLRDLCARLPYSPICHIIGKNGAEIDDKLTMSTIDHLDEWVVKPYLRPMSSMTEEEEKEYNDLYYNAPLRQYNRWRDAKYLEGLHVDWLNAHHFDYRGLIERGLAIAVTEENNPYKD